MLASRFMNNTGQNRGYGQLPDNVPGFDIGGNAFVDQPVYVSPSWPGAQVITVTGAVDRIYIPPTKGAICLIDARATNKTVLVQASRANAAPVGTYASVPAGAYGFLLSTSSGWLFVASSSSPPGPVPTTITDLWVAPLTGSDTTGDGSQTAPFATIRRAQQVIGFNPVFYANFTLHITEACAEDATLNWTIGTSGVVLLIDATMTVLASHVLTFVQDRVPAGNVRQQIGDGVTDWSSAIGKIIKDTRTDAYSAVTVNIGGGFADICTWLKFPLASQIITEPLAVNGDTVQVLDPLAYTGALAVHVSGPATLPGGGTTCIVRGFGFSGQTGLTMTSDGPVCYAVNCVHFTLPTFNKISAVNNDFEAFIPYGGGSSYTIVGGMCDGINAFVRDGAQVTITSGMVMEGGRLTASGGGTYILVHDMAVDQWTNDILRTEKGGVIAFNAAAAVWGASALATSCLLNVVDLGAFVLASGTTWALTLPATYVAADPVIVQGVAGAFPAGNVLQ